MKRLLFFLVLAFPLFSQQPDCSIPFQFTATGRQPTTGYNAGSLQTGCVGWILTYYATGFSGVSVRLDSADDSSGNPGSWGAFSGTALSASGCTTANPQTATGHGCLMITGANPWVSINVTSVSGSGTITGYAYGCRADHCSALFGVASSPSGGGGGGGSSTPLCNAQVDVTLSGTGYNTVVAASGSTVIKVCNIVWTSSSGGNPSVNTITVAFGSCGGSPTEAFQLAGVTGYTDSFNATLASAAGGALCVKESVANSDHVSITYTQS